MAHRAFSEGVSEGQRIVAECSHRIEPIRVKRSFLKTDLETLLNTQASVHHVLGCAVMALCQGYEVSELTDLLHTLIDELDAIGRKSG